MEMLVSAYQQYTWTLTEQIVYKYLPLGSMTTALEMV